MATSSNNIKILSDQICAEVQACLPQHNLQQAAAQKTLHQRVEQVLIDNNHHNDIPEARRVTILLSDIRGFTSLSERFSAMRVVELLNRYFSTMTEVIIRHGGTIDKLMGDAIMVLFGAPQSCDNDTERAIACAVEMQQAMSEFNSQNLAMGMPELFMGIGINTGDVVVGPVGSEHHREYTVIGDGVNLASRIEAHSLRGQVLISESTYALAKSYVLVGEPNQVMVKGKKQPVKLYDLMGTMRPHAMTVPRREIRKSPRVAVAMPCYFNRVNGAKVVDEKFQGEVIDLGYNGMSMKSPVKLEPFSEIKMAVSLQLLGENTTDIYARIVNTADRGNASLASLEFTTIDPIGQQTIKHFVDNQLYMP